MTEPQPLEGSINQPGHGSLLPAPRHFCEHGCNCWQRNLEVYFHDSPERSPEQIDNQEAHALLIARNRATRDLHRREEGMKAARRLVILSHSRLENSIDRIRSPSRRALWSLQLRLRWYERSARKYLVDSRAHWSDLCSLRDSLVARVRSRFGEAYETISYLRGMHQKAGGLAPEFSGGDGVGDLDLTGDFTGIGQPAPEWAALRELQKVIDRCDPEPLADELRTLLRDASDQLAGEADDADQTLAATGASQAT